MKKNNRIRKYNNDVAKKDVEHLPAEKRIELRGYRTYVGGRNAERWYSIGRLQYFFLVSQGLTAQHKFLDVGCGALRLGQYLIPFLDRGHYFGLEPEQLLVDCGLRHEIPEFIISQKQPTFTHNYRFEFEALDQFDFAMANSIFTHLTPEDITLCFDNLHQKTHPGSKFYFTFFRGNSTLNPDAASHANMRWEYTFSELQSFTDRWALDTSLPVLSGAI